jgi:hypothetical protein
VLPRSVTDYAGVATCTTDRSTYTAWLPAPIVPDVFCSSFKLQLAKVMTISIIYVIHVDHCVGAIPRRRKGGGDWGIQFGLQYT